MRYGASASTLLEWLAARAGKIPLPILDTIVAPVQAQALMAAVRSGALRELGKGPASAAELAARCDVDPECLRLVLRVLVALGYVARARDRFRLSASGRRYFGAQADQRYTDFVAYGPPQWDAIARTFEVLKNGRGIDLHASHTPAEWALYQRAMAENAAAFSDFVVAHCPVPPGARTCLDIGGSHGIVGSALARRHPPLRCEVLELPEAIPSARQIAEERGLLDVLTYREGDLTSVSFGDGEIDVALLCNILHHFSAETNRDILTRVHAALARGGSAAIFDLETPADDAEPEAAADAFSLYFRITSSSACFRAADYEAWARGAGFARVRTVRSVRLPSRLLVIAEK